MSYVNINLNSLSAQRQLNLNANSLGTSMQRLSSGLRINSAKDDAAGLAITERFSAQIRGTDQAGRNASDGISLVQTAEGALGSINDNLQRIRELAVQAANSTNSASDRAALQAEVNQLVAETDRIATQTQFNGTRLLDGNFTGQQFQLGANAGQTVTVGAIASARTSDLGRYYGTSGGFTIVQNASPPVLRVTLQSGASFVFGAVASDAKAVTAAFNSGLVAGLSAVAATTTVAAATQTSTGSATGVGVLTLNGVSINLGYTTGGGSANQQNRSSAVTAINAQSNSTGVLASDTGSGVSLAAADGRNIVTSYASGTATASVLSDFGLAAAGTTNSSVSVVYHDPLGAAGAGGNFIKFQGAGIAGGSIVTFNFAFLGSISNGTALDSIDVSSISGANTAIQSADEALSTINAARANLGAIQNRFQSAMGNLQSSSENMSASRSRIQDADFAQETANLSRAQILQQASTAMVAQANLLPQNVLALLK